MDPTQAILNAYAEIERRVDVCLRIQNGDSGRLRAQLREVVALKADVERVRSPYLKLSILIYFLSVQARNLLEREQYEVIHDSLEEMIAYLNGAITIASDDAGGDPVPVAYREEHGGTGRPRIHIDPTWLSHAHPGSSLKKIATLLGCSARTVRRRLIDYELAVPAPPVIQEVPQPDGTIAKEWHPTGPTGFDLKDEPDRLDQHVKEILERFPNYSLESIRAALRNLGFRVPRHVIRTSLVRVRGLQLCFINRPIERRVYSVPNVNSLWHHDGNHSTSPILPLSIDLS
jgi:hypothetical protein